MSELPLGPGALLFLGLYVLSLIAVGAWGRLRRQENSLSDHYLGGRDIGLGVLVLTLFATQYSGNSLFGFTGQAYRQGLTWLVILHAMIFVVVGYLLFAPRLQQVARNHLLITPPDYVFLRFPSPALRLIVSLCMIFALANYTLAQLKVMGHAVVGLSGGQISPLQGVLILAVIMLVYENLGGLRSVAWTDAIQGLLLLLGFGLILFMIERQLGGLAPALAQVSETAPDKLRPPDPMGAVKWISMVILIGVGASVYPQAIQRIYAARNGDALRRSMAMMALVPMLAVVSVLALGFVAIARYPGLEGAAADQVMALLLRDLLATGWLGSAVVTVMLAAILAALMSTADSALLALSSMVANDIYRHHWRPQARQAELTRVGKVSSWVVLALLVWVSTREHLTLVRLLVLKFEVLIQVAPAFYLGLNVPAVRTAPILAGVIAGLLTSLLLWSKGVQLGGLHPGVVGLMANLAVVACVQWLGPKKDAETRP